MVCKIISFVSVTSKVWNQLTVNTRTASTLGTFKARLNRKLNRTVYSRIPHKGQFISITTALPIHF